MSIKYSSSDSESDFDFTEDEEEVTWENIKDQKFRYGKAKGKTYRELIKTSRWRSYLKYQASWDKINESTKAHIECALERYEEVKAARKTRKRKRDEEEDPREEEERKEVEEEKED